MSEGVIVLVGLVVGIVCWYFIVLLVVVWWVCLFVLIVVGFGVVGRG